MVSTMSLKLMGRVTKSKIGAMKLNIGPWFMNELGHARVWNIYLMKHFQQTLYGEISEPPKGAELHHALHGC